MEHLLELELVLGLSFLQLLGLGSLLELRLLQPVLAPPPSPLL